MTTWKTKLARKLGTVNDEPVQMMYERGVEGDLFHLHPRDGDCAAKNCMPREIAEAEYASLIYHDPRIEASEPIRVVAEPVPPKVRRVAIVGFCQSSRDWVPYSDEDLEVIREQLPAELAVATEVWGLNRGYIFMQRADRWFEMHGEEIYSWDARRPGGHLAWLRNFKGPIYQHEQHPEIPNSKVFPLKEISEDLGLNVIRVGPMDAPTGSPSTSSGDRTAWSALPPADRWARADTQAWPYLTSSIAYEIALAIYEKFDEIALYGIDLNTAEEYAWQKPGVEYLLGIAAGRGIKVVIPTNCPLLNGTLYGRGHKSTKAQAHSYGQFEQRMTQLQNEQTQMGRQVNELRGALTEATYLRDQLIPGADHLAQDKRSRLLDKAMSEAEDRLTEHEGRMRALRRSMEELRAAAGESVAVREQIIPGANHEAMDRRVNEVNAALQDAGQRLMFVQGEIKETLLWMSQTMEGQEPREAIRQLDGELNHHIAQQSEGPLHYADALLAGINTDPAPSWSNPDGASPQTPLKNGSAAAPEPVAAGG